MKVFGMTLGAGVALTEVPGRDRRTVTIAGGVFAAVVLGAGGYLLLGSGSSDDGGTVASAPATSVPTTSASPTPGASPAPSLEAVAAAPARNPFQVLVAGAAGGAAANGTLTGGTAAGPSGPTDTSTDGTSTDGTASEPVTEPEPVTTEPVPTIPIPAPIPIPTPTTPPPTSEPRAAYPLTLGAIGPVSHAPRPLVWNVDSVEQTVIRGQRFGKYGELVVLSIRPTKSGNVAVLQIGTGDPVVIKVGATITIG